MCCFDRCLHCAQDMNVQFGQESLLKDAAPATLGQVTMSVEVSFLNSAVDATGKHSLLLLAA